ncbi:MAG: helix-turn-helix domain-containing protein [Ginsengibacter sp.]
MVSFVKRQLYNGVAKIIAVKNGTRKETIYKKASELFKGKGFGATFMRDIARAMGVEAPSLYTISLQKKEILRQICLKLQTCQIDRRKYS